MQPPPLQTAGKQGNPNQAEFPWDVRPVGILARIGLYTAVGALVLTSLILICLTVLGGGLAIGLRFPVTGAVLFFIGAAATVAVLWVMFRLIRRLGTSSMEKKCARADAQVFFLPVCFFRNYQGSGAVRFDENTLEVQGVLSQDLLPPLLIIITINAIALFLLLVFKHGIFLGGGGTLLVMVLYALFARNKPRTMVVRIPDLASIKCVGPVVTMKFVRPPVHGLSKIRLYIAEPYRRDFFRQMAERFARFLPESYLAAVGVAPTRAN